MRARRRRRDRALFVDEQRARSARANVDAKDRNGEISFEWALGAVRLPPDALRRDVLGREHLMLQGVHARGRLVDAAHERD